MAIVFSRTGVHNYDIWKHEFDSHEEIRARADIKVVGIFRNAESENDLLIAIDVPDADSFGELLKTPELSQAIRESGISTDVQYWSGQDLPTVTLEP